MFFAKKDGVNLRSPHKFEFTWSNYKPDSVQKSLETLYRMIIPLRVQLLTPLSSLPENTRWPRLTLSYLTLLRLEV